MILWTLPDNSTAWTTCADGIDEAAHAAQLLADGRIPDGSTYTLADTIPKAELDKMQKAGRNARRLARLAEIDQKTVRGLREFVVAKFGSDPLLPNVVKTNETDSAAKRAELEP